jgi:DNA-directed RNA polymerase specialized sigma24 family protein
MVDIEPELNGILIDWAKWCRGHAIPMTFWVGCKSIESGFVGELGDVHEDTEGRHTKALETAETRPEYLCLEIEKAVMRLPEKHRTALRLHYVIRKQLPMSQKRRILGVSQDGYIKLVTRSALMIKNCINLHCTY